MENPPATTIFARASGAGRAGVALFRLSGPAAFAIAEKLIGFAPSRVPRLAGLVDPANGALIDRGLVFGFAGPASFTGEDVVEFTLHGSRAVEDALFAALVRLGARPAEAGEFTLRAFRAGKMDLAQVEALADLLEAETSLQRKQALGQLGGRLSARAEAWRASLLAILTPLEAAIDFPDEADIPAEIAARAAPEIARLKSSLAGFLDESIRARMIREGAAAAIIGAPNAGKSSLVNALAGSDVAIVSDMPGTTRDVVEVRLDIGGVAVTVADTAGLRDETADLIEAEGMRRARVRADSADIRILVIDAAAGDVSRETRALLRPGDIIAWNKADLAAPAFDGGSGHTQLALSAKTGAGVPDLLAALTARLGQAGDAGGPALTRARHVAAVEDALAALDRAEAALDHGPELAAEDVRLAARALGAITGAVGVEDVLGEIFSSFCIGK